MRLELIRHQHIDDIWPHLAEGMDEACRRSGGGCTGPWLFQECRGERALLMAIFDQTMPVAGLVCRIEQWGANRVFNVLMACGRDMRGWLNVLQTDHFWPAKLGCDKIVFEGRKGWAKSLPETRIMSVSYEMDVKHGN